MAPNIQTPPPADEEEVPHQYHHFVAPEAWTRSPIMRVLSPPSNRTCSTCDSSTNITQILSSITSIDFSSPTGTIQKYTNGASEKCFSCTIILGLLRSIRTEDSTDREIEATTAVQRANNTWSGVCEVMSNRELQPRYWQIFVPETAPSCLVNVPRLPVLGGPSSSEAIRFVKQQIKTCLKAHAECKSQVADFIPTRLLHITRDGEMHLRFQTDIPTSTKYAALSHRWGRERLHRCSTTRDNIDSRKQNIPWDELPQLFHDAVAFTIRLGLSYIWIDSLCIVQGDDLDWARETSDMARIFNGALVTIATHCSQSPSETMFPTHGALQHKIVTLKQGTKQHDLYARELTPATAGIMHKTDGELAPLFERAWPFQECLVSSRVIHVGPRELSFECRAYITCECGQHYCDNDSITPRHVLARMPETSPIITRFFQKPRPVDDWLSMVEHYSQLALEVEKDRLIALGGYAQQYLQAHPGRQYLAGIWSNDLHRQLLWRTTSTPQHSPTSPCIAPSWSWASAGAAVEYPWKNMHDHLRLSYKVLDFSCRPVDGNPFGAAIEGKIRLKGCLLSAKLVVMPISVSDGTSDSDSEVLHHTSFECDGLPDGYHLNDTWLDRAIDPEAGDSGRGRSLHDDASDDVSLSSGDSTSPGITSLDVTLLKLFDIQRKTDEVYHPSVVYMIVREVPEPEKPDTYSILPGPVYQRLGIAVASLDGGQNRKDSMESRPSVSTRRSSIVDGWNRMMAFGGNQVAEMGEVVII